MASANPCGHPMDAWDYITVVMQLPGRTTIFLTTLQLSAGLLGLVDMYSS